MILPGIIEELVKRHRQIDAVHFIQAFGLSETFPPVPLLKTCIEESKDVTENNLDANASLSKVCSSTLRRFGCDCLMIYTNRYSSCICFIGTTVSLYAALRWLKYRCFSGL
jgi:hypothetical protein